MAILPRRRAIPDRTSINVDWLVRLRWAEIVGQSATVLVAQVVFGVALPTVPLLMVIGVGLLSNLALEVRLGRGQPASLQHRADSPDDAGRSSTRTSRPVGSIEEGQLAAVMALDIVLLTALLFLSGGPHNPFGSLYLVQIALATVMVRALWTWMLVGLSFVGFGLLLVANEPLPMSDSTRMVGMWVALGVASAFVVHFLLRITGALAARESELAAARHLTARQERLASLATMAAGAAHELSTPLGTVALAAKELERALIGRSERGRDDALDLRLNQQLVDDARLIREQVGRCRGILDQMAQGAGTIGESLSQVSVSELIDEAVSGTRALPTIHRELPPAVAELVFEGPRRAVTSALRSLLTNAQDASSVDHAVVLRARVVVVDEEGPAGRASRSRPRRSQLVITIDDRGSGMTAEVLSRIGEPFFTTKSPGRGMGLGMFLSRAVVEGVGGTLQIDSVAGRGTTAQVTLPLSPAVPDESSSRSAASQLHARSPAADAS